MKKLIIMSGIALMCFTSCKKETAEPDVKPDSAYVIVPPDKLPVDTGIVKQTR